MNPSSFQKKERNGELVFDDLDAKTSHLTLSEDSKKEQSELSRRKSIHKKMNLSEYMSGMDAKNPVSHRVCRAKNIVLQKRKSIKKMDQKASTMSLNLAKNVGGDKESVSSQRSNSLESPGLAGNPAVGLSIFEAATMMRNIG